MVFPRILCELSVNERPTRDETRDSICKRSRLKVGEALLVSASQPLLFGLLGGEQSIRRWCLLSHAGVRLIDVLIDVLFHVFVV